MAEYIEREAAIAAAKHAWSKGLEPSQYIEVIPAADVVPLRHGQWIPVTESDLVHRKEILDKLDKWMCTVKRNLCPGLMKTTILDTLAHVTEDIQAMKSISPEQVMVECNIYDQEHIYRDCTVQILENTRTGEISVGWWQNDKEEV